MIGSIVGLLTAVGAKEAFDALDQAIAGLLEVDVSAVGAITVDPAAALACKMLRLAGTLAADAGVVVPDNRKLYFVHNATAAGPRSTAVSTTPPSFIATART